MKRIYLASSWRNQDHGKLLHHMRMWGHQVYDFRDPARAFKWSQVDMPDKPLATIQREILQDNQRAAQGFMCDFRAMLWADTCVLLLPCGRSAHLEAGYCAGSGRRTIVFLQDNEEPDLMNLLMHEMVTSMKELKDALM